MVSFWPWGGDDSSPAGFEKVLSALSKKITESQARLERMRLRSRKAKVLGTLYLSFAYLVYAIVLLLVVGYKNLGASEWTGMAGGPVLIYTARVVITSYYTFRIDSLETRLNEQQEERSKTIQKLKDATKYDSTMELIEKYGGVEDRPRSRQQEDPDDSPDGKKPQSGQGAPSPSRTHMAPPPTANIQRRDGPPSRPVTPQVHPPNSLDPTAEFAPNAFNQPPPQGFPGYAYDNSYGPPESHWYDRIFDVLLGEDETAAKNRIVLICQNCRLVNGQAPPGTKSLAEVGIWICMACRSKNGEIDEGKRIVREVLAKAEEEKDDKDALEEDVVKIETVDAETSSTGADTDGPAASVKARRAKGKK